MRPPVEPRQYTSIRFTETPALEGLCASIGSIGDAYDNAAAETVIGLYKNEAVRADSPFRTGPLRDQHDVEQLTLEYVHWYNNDRLHGYTDGYHTPEEYEQTYHTHQPGAPTGAAANNKAA